MRNYTWKYGIFHWFVHYFLTWTIIVGSGTHIFPVILPLDLFGTVFQVNVLDIFLGCLITTVIDIDHLPIVFKFGFRRVVFGQKRMVQPLHNFFFLAFFSILAAIFALFLSKDIAVFIFIIALHMIWDIAEDVLMFKTSFRRWEKTWGLDTKDLQIAYNELLQTFFVKKRDGTLEQFSQEKVYESVMKAGAIEPVAKSVSDYVAKRVKNNMSTKKIGLLVITDLKKLDKDAALNYQNYFLKHHNIPSQKSRIRRINSMIKRQGSRLTARIRRK